LRFIGVGFYVFIRGLRTKIAINIAILLFLAMLLVDLVTIVTVKRELIRSEVFKANILLSSFENSLLDGILMKGRSPDLSPGLVLTRMLDDPQLAAVLVLDSDGEQIFLHRNRDVAAARLHQSTKATLSSRHKSIHFTGTSWGIFWKQTAHLTLSAPLLKDGEILGGISVVLSLDRVYQALRNSQKIFCIYLFINLTILTFVGIYRISKLYLQPLARLAKRAEDYKEDDELIFAVRKEDNELNRLSKALNSMLKRISADKEKLRSTVLSLEEANLELKKAQREIIRAEKLASVGRLAAGIAHEIGNPIGIVIGYLDLLKQKDIAEDENREYIQRTEQEIERINTIIRQLLEISRPSNSGRMAVAVHDLIHDTADVLRVQPLMSKIKVCLSLDSDEDTVWADPNQLRQVFLNLIINAADAISSKDQGGVGKLKITTERDMAIDSENRTNSDHLKISFIDDGPGIAEENLSNIFDPFFTTKDPGKGTGLGLSVSFMIVEGLGGKMTGISELGKGTTMMISLPLFKPEDKMRRLNNEDSEGGSKEGRTLIRTE
jgi:two-component system NtrC family sensor kinase